jgi:hypothetical protein
MKVPFKIVVEESEYDLYAEHIPKKRILVLDEKFRDEYDTCDNLGDSKTKGSGPARNFIWDHAKKSGTKFHWTMDDNIFRFLRWNKNRQVEVDSGAPFRAMEDFVLRYSNILMAGPQYFMFAPRKKSSKEVPPVVFNTRVFSCILLKTDGPYRWRARYNEDVDLSLRILKGGYCTAQFNAFLQHKLPTQTVKGGNTDELYKDGTSEKSQMIVNLHPDVARVTYRFSRVHHYVNYGPFRNNALKYSKEYSIKKGTNEYGMKLKKVSDGKSKKK